MHVAALQRGDGLAAALEGDEAHRLRIEAGRLGGERRLHPVLAADRAAGAEHDLGRVGLDRGHQVLQRLVGRRLGHHDRAVVGADGGEPAHVVFVVAAELALRQVEQRAARERDDGVGRVGLLGDDGVVGHGADAARHVGHAHRVGDELALLQRALHQLAGEVETATGLGGGDALGFFQGARSEGGEGAGRDGRGDELGSDAHESVSSKGWNPRNGGAAMRAL